MRAQHRLIQENILHLLFFLWSHIKPLMHYFLEKSTSSAPNHPENQDLSPNLICEKYIFLTGEINEVNCSQFSLHLPFIYRVTHKE